MGPPHGRKIPALWGGGVVVNLITKEPEVGRRMEVQMPVWRLAPRYDVLLD